MSELLRFTSSTRHGERNGYAAATVTLESIDTGHEFVSLVGRDVARHVPTIAAGVQSGLAVRFGKNTGACHTRVTLHSIEPGPTGNECLEDIGSGIASRILETRHGA